MSKGKLGSKKEKSKIKNHQMRKGSRLKLKEGDFAKVERTPQTHETTVRIKVYIDSNYKDDPIRNIPFGQFAEVIRY